jgi:hypothetical protein
MLVTPPPHSEVCLLRGLWPGATMFSYPKAELQLTDSTVRCILTEHSGWVAKKLGIPDLKTRLRAGETVTAFEFPVHSYDIRWPKPNMGTAFQISDGAAPRWTVSFILPNPSESVTSESDGGLISARGSRKQWREALEPKHRDNNLGQ